MTKNTLQRRVLVKKLIHLPEAQDSAKRCQAFGESKMRNGGKVLFGGPNSVNRN
jgi:hypothetical protein